MLQNKFSFDVPFSCFLFLFLFFCFQGSLLSVLRQFARLKSDKQAISVGFVGYPNVGKSSVINTLRTKNVMFLFPFSSSVVSVLALLSTSPVNLWLVGSICYNYFILEGSKTAHGQVNLLVLPLTYGRSQVGVPYLLITWLLGEGHGSMVLPGLVKPGSGFLHFVKKRKQ